MPIGTILPYVGSLADIPNGWHLCDGTDGTPDLTNRFLEGTIASPGNYIEPGLPNITGLFHIGDEFTHTSIYGPGPGVFYKASSGIYGNVAPNIQNKWESDVGFDASRSSAIYGASETVQPRSYTVYFIMKMK